MYDRKGEVQLGSTNKNESLRMIGRKGVYDRKEECMIGRKGVYDRKEGSV